MDFLEFHIICPAWNTRRDELNFALGADAKISELLGQPSMQYLARRRLQVAAQELLNGKEFLTTAAEQVGCASEAAFKRAFNQEFGMPPASW